MSIEKEIVSYLHEYGNTKEDDIINYGVQKFDYSLERMKRVIKRMVINNSIHYVVHNRLEPPGVYISLKEPLPPETAKILLEAFLQMKENEEGIQKSARAILEEAASRGENRIKEM